MSEEKEIKKEATDESKNLVDVNVALVIAERDEVTEKLSKALDKIEELEKKLANANAIIEEDTKATLINKIAPKTIVDKSILSKMSIEKLSEWDKVLDGAKTVTFTSGTPYSYDKPDQRQKLADINKDYMAKLRGGNK